MIDTIRVSIPGIEVKNTDWVKYEKVTINKVENKVMSKLISGFEKEKNYPRITYYRGDKNMINTSEFDKSRIVLEVSLPKLSRGENYTLMSDADLDQAKHDLIVLSSDLLKVSLPDIDSFSLSRLDCCYSWLTDDNMQSYFNILKQLPISGYTRVPYTDTGNDIEGFSWIAKNKKVNFYDKSKESQLSFVGLLRMENQLLNKSSVRVLADRLGVKSNGNMINNEIARSELTRWLERIGMQENYHVEKDLLRDLIKEYGINGSHSRYFFMKGYERYGLNLKDMIPERTYKRYYAEAKKRNYLLSSPITLPGLKIER